MYKPYPFPPTQAVHFTIAAGASTTEVSGEVPADTDPRAVVFFGNALQGLFDIVVPDAPPLSTDEWQVLALPATMERLNKAHGLKSHQPECWRVAAEQVAGALYELWRELSNQTDRASRHGRSGAFAPDHQAYTAFSKSLIGPVLLGRVDQAERAARALRELLPGKTDAQLGALVAKSFLALLSVPHHAELVKPALLEY